MRVTQFYLLCLLYVLGVLAQRATKSKSKRVLLNPGILNSTAEAYKAISGNKELLSLLRKDYLNKHLAAITVDEQARLLSFPCSQATLDAVINEVFTAVNHHNMTSQNRRLGAVVAGAALAYGAVEVEAGAVIAVVAAPLLLAALVAGVAAWMFEPMAKEYFFGTDESSINNDDPVVVFKMQEKPKPPAVKPKTPGRTKEKSEDDDGQLYRKYIVRLPSTEIDARASHDKIVECVQQSMNKNTKLCQPDVNVYRMDMFIDVTDSPHYKNNNMFAEVSAVYSAVSAQLSRTCMAVVAECGVIQFADITGAKLSHDQDDSLAGKAANRNWHLTSTTNPVKYEKDGRKLEDDHESFYSQYGEQYSGQGVTVYQMDTSIPQGRINATNLRPPRSNVQVGEVGGSVENIQFKDHGLAVASMIKDTELGLAQYSELYYCSPRYIDDCIKCLQVINEHFVGENQMNPSIFVTSLTTSILFREYSDSLRTFASSGINAFICSAGNQALQEGASIQLPGSLPEYLAVGGLDFKLKQAKFSNYGLQTNIYGPGVAIQVASNQKIDHVSWNGTSFASPIVAGVAASFISQVINANGIQYQFSRFYVHARIMAAASRGLVESVGVGRRSQKPKPIIESAIYSAAYDDYWNAFFKHHIKAVFSDFNYYLCEKPMDVSSDDQYTTMQYMQLYLFGENFLTTCALKAATVNGKAFDYSVTQSIALEQETRKLKKLPPLPKIEGITAPESAATQLQQLNGDIFDYVIGTTSNWTTSVSCMPTTYATALYISSSPQKTAGISLKCSDGTYAFSDPSADGPVTGSLIIERKTGLLTSDIYPMIYKMPPDSSERFLLSNIEMKNSNTEQHVQVKPPNSQASTQPWQSISFGDVVVQDENIVQFEAVKFMNQPTVKNTQKDEK